MEKIENIRNDNIDVCVKTKSRDYTFVIVTLENLKDSKWLDKRGFIIPGAPFLIVEELTKETIETLVEEIEYLSEPETTYNLEVADFHTYYIYSINNRRLYAYRMAGSKSVPVEWVSRNSMEHFWTGDGINFYLRRK